MTDRERPEAPGADDEPERVVGTARGQQSGTGGGEVGYGRPPVSGQFARGRSGNPKGRPKGTGKARALTAYYEWMPIREPAPGVSLIQASERSFQFGDLASLIMIETRLGARDVQLNLDRDLPMVDGKPDVAAFAAKWKDSSRRMMGEGQEQWLASEIGASVKANISLITNNARVAGLLAGSLAALA